MGKRCETGKERGGKEDQPKLTMMKKPYINLLHNKLKYILKKTEFKQRYLAWIDNAAS